MILIVKDSDDSNSSYLETIEWLRFYNTSIQFFKGSDFYENGYKWSIKLNSTLNVVTLINNNIRCVWYTGFLSQRKYMSSKIENIYSTNDNITELKQKILNEVYKINNQLFQNFNYAYQLPKISNIGVDKFSTLKRALKIGLDIPPSIITNSKKELLSFYKENESLITKPLFELISFYTEKEVTYHEAKLYNETEILELEDKFFPSFFQKYMDKDIEIRSFFIEGKFYSMAIFSQLDKQTSIDYRNYNREQPNRNVPYQLPKRIEKKLKILMFDLKLNTGSIDIIKTKENKYVFLEVNPTGQFGFVSKSCNYYLEEVIAKTLIEYDN